MQKKGSSQAEFCFWACFADLPGGGLKADVIRECGFKVKVHGTFPVASWMHDRIQGRYRCRSSRLLSEALPWTYRHNVV